MPSENSSSREQHGSLAVAAELAQFVRAELAPAAAIDDLPAFWRGVERLARDFAGRNQSLLTRRAELQQRINRWHQEQPEGPLDVVRYEAFLRDIGYLVDEGSDFQIEVDSVDPEVAELSGPQLVVPVSNARYALNAANARWVSLYDALYGTDVLPEPPGAEKGNSYNPVRGELVVEYAERFLSQAAPLASGSYPQVTSYEVTPAPHTLVLTLDDGSSTQLEDPSQFVGFRSRDGVLQAILLKNNGLHVEVVIDSNHPVGELIALEFAI